MLAVFKQLMPNTPEAKLRGWVGVLHETHQLDTLGELDDLDEIVG
jgi:hypothetical protein